MEAAAVFAALGVDPFVFLRADAVEGLFLTAVAKRAQEIVADWRDDLATRTINALGESMK